jgi:cytochrome c biogenesis protein CcmG/thiol:disulfide interchange protein DsbE
MSDRLRLLRVVGLVGVGVLLVVALVVGAGRGDEPARQAGPDATPPVDLAPLREAAALGPCPAGLGPELPDLVLPCLGGGDDVRLHAASPGRPTLVNVWATWCAPCVREVPELVAFADRAGDRVGVVGVLTQDTARNGLEFSRQFGVRYPSLVDDDREVLTAYGSGPPITLFVDAGGRVAHVERGELTSVDEIVQLVEQHLGVSV